MIAQIFIVLWYITKQHRSKETTVYKWYMKHINWSDVLKKTNINKIMYNRSSSSYNKQYQDISPTFIVQFKLPLTLDNNYVKITI